MCVQLNFVVGHCLRYTGRLAETDDAAAHRSLKKRRQRGRINATLSVKKPRFPPFRLYLDGAQI